MSSADIYILGQKYTIKGDASAEHIQELSKYVDDMTKEVCTHFPNIPPNKALVLTLFNMAGELHKLKAEQEILTNHIKEKTELLSDILE